MKTNKLFHLFSSVYLLFAVCLAACDFAIRPVEITQIPLITSPTPEAAVPEVPEIVTLEPTPTTAVCTPLPDDMRLNVRYESSQHGVIEVEGLQPGEKPIVLITGDAPTGSYREETTTTHAVGADGRFQHEFDFRSWPSIEGYEFKGQLIHQHGVACFTIDLPLDEPPVGMVGLAVLVAASRYHYVFDTQRGVLLQHSGETLLTSGEWQLIHEVNFTQFDLLAELPDNAAYTLQEGTALLAAAR